MRIDFVSNPKMPEGTLGVFVAKQFTSYSLLVRARDAIDLLADEDGANKFLKALDPDLRAGGLSSHVPNKHTLNDIKFAGVSTTLALGGDLREIPKQQRLELLQQVAQILSDRYDFEKVTFRNPLNERENIQYPAAAINI